MPAFADKKLAPDFECSTCDWIDYQEVSRAITEGRPDAGALLGSFFDSHLAPESIERLARFALAQAVKETKKAVDEDKAQDGPDAARALQVHWQQFVRVDMAQCCLPPKLFGVALMARLLAAAESGELAPQAAELRAKLDERYNVTDALKEMRSFGADLYFNFDYVETNGHARKSPHGYPPLFEP